MIKGVVISLPFRVFRRYENGFPFVGVQPLYKIFQTGRTVTSSLMKFLNYGIFIKQHIDHFTEHTRNL